MTETQIKQKFKETYPDFMRGDEPLSPYFDIWEYGIEIAQQGIELLSKHLLEMQATNGALTDKINELEKRFEPQAFTEVMNEIEENYNNKVKLAEAKDILTKILQRMPSFEAKSIEDLSLLNALSQAEQFLKGVTDV